MGHQTRKKKKKKKINVRLWKDILFGIKHESCFERNLWQANYLRKRIVVWKEDELPLLKRTPDHKLVLLLR